MSVHPSACLRERQQVSTFHRRSALITENTVNQDQKARAGGLFFVGGGAVLAYLSIWLPYQQARAGAQTVSLNRSGITLAVLFPLVGLILTAGGETAANHIKAQTTGKKTKLGWVYVAVIAAIALGVYLVVENKFEQMGYTL